MSQLCVMQVKVVFCPPGPVKIAAIRLIYTEVKDENLSRLILILQGKIMSTTRESIKEIFRFKVDTFQVSFCLICCLIFTFFPVSLGLVQLGVD